MHATDDAYTQFAEAVWHVAGRDLADLIAAPHAIANINLVKPYMMRDLSFFHH